MFNIYTVYSCTTVTSFGLAGLFCKLLRNFQETIRPAVALILYKVYRLRREVLANGRYCRAGVHKLPNVTKLAAVLLRLPGQSRLIIGGCAENSRQRLPGFG